MTNPVCAVDDIVHYTGALRIGASAEFGTPQEALRLQASHKRRAYETKLAESRSVSLLWIHIHSFNNYLHDERQRELLGVICIRQPSDIH